MSASALFRPTFTDLRSEIERRVAEHAPAEEISDLIDQFLAAGGSTPAPVVEYDGTVTWLYRSAKAESVAVVGDIIGFDPRTTRMARLPGCDLFYMTAQLPLDAQVAYAFAVDSAPPEGDDAAAWSRWLARCTPDPLNPQLIMSPGLLKVASVLVMPSAPNIAEFPEHDPSTVQGMAVHLIGSASQGIWRRVWVSLPPHYDSSAHHPAIYFLDGESYTMAARAPELARALVYEQQIAPAVQVFIEGLGDLAAADLEHYLGETVVPWIEAHYSVYRAPYARIVAGASTAGAAALLLALQRPDLFGGVVAQSPTTDLEPGMARGMLRQAVERGHDLPRCYVDVGRYESPAVIEYAQGLCSALIEGGAAVAYQEFAGDHSFLGWRSSLPDALRFHLGAGSLSDI